MKKNIKSFLAMALCSAMTISSSVVPALANTTSAVVDCQVAAAQASQTGEQAMYCPYTGQLLGTNSDGLWQTEGTTTTVCTEVTTGQENIYVDPCYLDGVYTYCPPSGDTTTNTNTFNEVSKLMLTNATVTALFDRPYKDHGFMENYLTYVSESIESYFCPTLGIDLYNGSAAGYNKVLISNRVIQIPVGTTMRVPASTALEMRYLSANGSSICSLQTSELKHFTLSSVIYNLVSNNIVGHFPPVTPGDGYTYITFKDSGMYTLFAQANPFQVTTIHGSNEQYYTSSQLSLMLQYSVILVVSNECLPFSWYLPGDNDYNHIGTIVSPVVGTVAIPSTGIMHTVEEGDTLYSLAKTYYGSELFVNKVYNANSHRIADQTALIVGQQIYLPK
ncbi:MAG: LysM domain-containing protein [bacterium]